MAQLVGSDNPLTSQLVALAMPKSSSKKPNKSTAVVTAKTDYNPTIAGDDLIKANARRSKKDSFTVKYYVGEKNGKADYLTFNFALLPAIDNIVNYSASGPFRGNESVPEVKPGIPIRIAMKHRNTVIPGGTNVVQTIGIDSKYIVLVGAFVGTEKSTSEASVGSTYYDTIYQRAGNPKEQLPQYNSYKQAMLFNKEVVEKGAPVNIIVQTEGQVADDSIKVTGVIVDFKIQAVREAKTYYAMTVLYTDQAKANKGKVAESNPEKKDPTAEQKDPKKLTSREVIKKEGLLGRVWDDALAKKIGGVYGFWGETDGSHVVKRITEPGGEAVVYEYRRQDDKGFTLQPPEDNIIYLSIIKGAGPEPNKWYIKDAGAGRYKEE